MGRHWENFEVCVRYVLFCSRSAGHVPNLRILTFPNCPLDDTSILQATSGVHEAGIGFRRSKDLALPAFIASRLESRWIVEKLS